MFIFDYCVARSIFSKNNLKVSHFLIFRSRFIDGGFFIILPLFILALLLMSFEPVAAYSDIDL